MLIFPSQSGATCQIATSLRSSPSSCISPSIDLITLSTSPALGGRQQGHHLAEQHRCRGLSPRASRGQLLLSPGGGTVPVGTRQTRVSVTLCLSRPLVRGRVSFPVPSRLQPGESGSGVPDQKPGRAESVRPTGRPCIPGSERSPAHRASPCRPPVRTACFPRR